MQRKSVKRKQVHKKKKFKKWEPLSITDDV